MKTLIRLFAIVVATTGICLPRGTAAAQPPLGGGGQATNFVQDVELSPRNRLAVQVVDPQGKPVEGTRITIRRATAPSAQATQAQATMHHAVSGKDGQVVVPSLTPGVFEITSGSRGGIYRVWAPQTAPPRVTSGILLISEGGVVRGSRGGWQKAAIVGGVIITSGVVGGVIGYNLKDAS